MFKLGEGNISIEDGRNIFAHPKNLRKRDGKRSTLNEWR